MAKRVSILIPAAGFGRRMRGQDKLLREIAGVPLLRRTAERALSTGCAVCVTLPADNADRAAALHGLDIETVQIHDADKGMSRSIVHGVGALKDQSSGILIMPADMPEIDSDDMTALIDQFAAIGGQHIMRATTADGTPGHPVIFPPDCFAALMNLSGDEGARSVVKSATTVKLVALPDNHALTDLDTPEAWDDWLSKHHSN